MPVPKIRSLVPIFGSNRTLAEVPGALLAGCSHVMIPFLGSGPELWYIKAPTIVCGDLHRHIVNLALTIQNSRMEKLLARRLEKTPFHPDQLKESQYKCRVIEETVNVVLPTLGPPPTSNMPNLDWAFHYFVASWMARSGSCGTKDEFRASYSIRYCDGGGDSNTRFRNAIKALDEWNKSVMQKCTFDVLPWKELLNRGKDEAKHGIYIDSTFPDTGKNYRHTMSDQELTDLATFLDTYVESPICIRYYDHPLIRKLYPKSKWTWLRLKGRKQTNEEGNEVYITRRCAEL